MSQLTKADLYPATSRGALASLALAAMLSSLGASSPHVALPTLAAVFGASFQQVQWVVLAYLLVVTSVIVSAGRLGDLVGRRRLLLAGMGLFTLASALCALAPTVALLLAARVAQGLGAAAMMALSMAFVGETVPQAARGRALGLLGSMSAIGTALGPSLGGALLAWFGWPAIFGMHVPLELAACLLAYRFLPPDRARSAVRPRFDHAGMVLLALALAAYALAMTLGRGSVGALNFGLLGCAAGVLYLFVRTEHAIAAPLVPVAMLADRTLGAGLAANAMVSTVMMATLVVGPFYLARGLGLGPVQVGLVLAIGPVAAALCGVPAGLLSDRFGPRAVTRAGLLLVGGGALALALLPLRVGLPGYIAPLVGMTVGYALFQTANNTAVMARAAAGEGGVVSGMLNLARNLGLVTGASAMGGVFAYGAGTWNMVAARPEAVAAGTRLAFGAATIIIVAALGLTWAGVRRARCAA